MLERVAQLSFRRRRVVLGAWVLLLIVLGASQGAAGSNWRTEFRLPDTESKDGFDILEDRFAGQATGAQSGTVVFRAEEGIEDPQVRQTMTAMFDAIRQVRSDHSPDKPLQVLSPYEPGGEQQIASTLPGQPDNPEAGRIAYAGVEFPLDFDQADFINVADQVRDLIPEHVPGLQVELGGEAFAEFEPPSSETIGLVGAIFILLAAFGSVLAMGLPVGVALAGIGTGTSLVTLFSHLVAMPDFTVQLGAMIGLGVGIDYALFIVTRYREGLHAGLQPEHATITALDTAGRAVIFAGLTVVISLMGMFFMGLSFVNGLAIGASVTVALTMLASITLLPALLGFAGHKVETTRWRGLVAVVFVALALLAIGVQVPALALPFLLLAVLTIVASFFAPVLRRDVPKRHAKPLRQTFWYRWSRLVQHRPWRMLALGLVALLLLALPVLSLRLGFSDTGSYPSDTTTRKAYDLTVRGFGPGFNGPLVLATELPGGRADEAALQAVADAVGGTPGVVFATAPRVNDEADPTAAQMIVFPDTSPQDEETTQLVHALRDEVLPSATAGTGLDVAVTGTVAANIDFADYLSARLPIFFGAVLALSFLLLMVVFRSVLVPLKAVIVNLLSIGAAYGAVVAVFQWGWLKDVFGVGDGGPIEAWVPMMMFAIVFGLSMDYEVFLLSRIREEFLRTRNNATAVADGLATTARVITAAAAIMVFVFGSFLLEANRQIKLFGLGLAFAVLLDATLVRMILVPSTMELLGERNWWIPRWLDRVLPRVDVEGHHAELPTLEEQLEEEREPATLG